eukprot:COSAG02_NODE_42839_length_380_cov_1.423488_1_plen_101_part_01
MRKYGWACTDGVVPVGVYQGGESGVLPGCGGCSGSCSLRYLCDTSRILFPGTHAYRVFGVCFAAPQDDAKCEAATSCSECLPKKWCGWCSPGAVVYKNGTG